MVPLLRKLMSTETVPISQLKIKSWKRKLLKDGCLPGAKPLIFDGRECFLE